VKEAKGKTVILTDRTTHKRSQVLMVPHNTVIAPTTENKSSHKATQRQAIF
jgi:hypothetical protein